jgi:hypothetical protein
MKKKLKSLLHILLAAALLVPVFTARGDALLMENPYVRIACISAATRCRPQIWKTVRTTASATASAILTITTISSSWALRHRRRFPC